MKKYRYFLYFAFVLLATNFVSCKPYEDDSMKMSRNMAPIMQTLLTDVAKELITKSASNSQILKLNMTNVLILLLLKGLLWGASYASPNAYPKNRSEDNDSQQFITETEVLLLLSYLVGDEKENNFECLHRVACEDPKKAKEYSNAGWLLIKAVNSLGIESYKNDRYEKLLKNLNEAIEFSDKGGTCESKYSCGRDSDNNV